MSISQLITQVVIIFLLMLLGAIIRKFGFLHLQSINDITNIALYFLSPMVILKAFQQPFSSTRMHTFLLTLEAIFVSYLVTIILTKVVFSWVKDPNMRHIVSYGSIYSNNGFMGVPLAQALFGDAGVFYAVASLIGFNVMSWTHGVSLFHRRTNESWAQKIRKIILNPNIIAIIVGLVTFCCSIHFPPIIGQFLIYGSAAFTPISMMIIGSNLVGIQLKDIKLGIPASTALLLRNVLYPLVNLVALKLLGVTNTAINVTVILAACPVAGLVVLFTLQAKGDPKPAVTLMSISTILSLITIPLVFAIANWK